LFAVLVDCCVNFEREMMAESLGVSVESLPAVMGKETMAGKEIDDDASLTT
jgi:hypothetical protein